MVTSISIYDITHENLFKYTLSTNMEVVYTLVSTIVYKIYIYIVIDILAI